MSGRVARGGGHVTELTTRRPPRRDPTPNTASSIKLITRKAERWRRGRAAVVSGTWLLLCCCSSAVVSVGSLMPLLGCRDGCRAGGGGVTGQMVVPQEEATGVMWVHEVTCLVCCQNCTMLSHICVMLTEIGHGIGFYHRSQASNHCSSCEHVADRCRPFYRCRSPSFSEFPRQSPEEVGGWRCARAGRDGGTDTTRGRRLIRPDRRRAPLRQLRRAAPQRRRAAIEPSVGGGGGHRAAGGGLSDTSDPAQDGVGPQHRATVTATITATVIATSTATFRYLRPAAVAAGRGEPGAPLTHRSLITDRAGPNSDMD